MRLFIAVEIEPRVADAIAACADELRRRSDQSPRTRITWVPRDRMHVTVRFIGDVDSARAETITAALAPDLPRAPFDLTLEGVGTFPPHGAPRVLWAGVGAGADALRVLEGDISARLDRCGVPREDRPYHPHVTLARVRDAGALRTSAWLDGLAAPRFGITPVNAITLFESRSSRQGHVYISVRRTVLNGVRPW